MDVNQLEWNCVESPKIEVNSLFWTIKLCKSSNSVKPSLISHLAEDASKWTCSAKAYIKLQSPVYRNQYDQKLEKTIEKQTFDIENPKHGIDELVKWDDLLANYVYENKIYIEVKISADQPVRNKQIEISSTNVEIYVKNVRIVTQHVVSSSLNFIARGITWKVGYAKIAYGLSFFLEAEKGNFGKRESWQVKAIFELKSWSNTAPDIIKYGFSERFDKNSASSGYRDFVKWNEIFHQNTSYNNKYLKDDMAWFNVQIEVNDPKLG